MRGVDEREGGVVDFGEGSPTLLIEVDKVGLNRDLAVARAGGGNFLAGRHLGRTLSGKAKSTRALASAEEGKSKPIGLNTAGEPVECA